MQAEYQNGHRAAEPRIAIGYTNSSVNLTLTSDILDRLTAHMKSVHPQEGCGFLIGHGATAGHFLAMPNSLASETAYEIEPALLAAVNRSLRDSGEQLVAIVHSHPRGPAEPSLRDRERAFYPEAAHVIVSLADLERPQLRAFRIIDGEAYEIECHIVL